MMCTTPLTPQGNHRYAAQQSEVHRSYFASPRIDLNPRLIFKNFLCIMQKICLLYFLIKRSPSGHLGQTESNRSAAGVLRFFHRKKGGGRLELICYFIHVSCALVTDILWKPSGMRRQTLLVHQPRHPANLQDADLA